MGTIALRWAQHKRACDFNLLLIQVVRNKICPANHSWYDSDQLALITVTAHQCRPIKKFDKGLRCNSYVNGGVRKRLSPDLAFFLSFLPRGYIMRATWEVLHS